MDLSINQEYHDGQESDGSICEDDPVLSGSSVNSHSASLQNKRLNLEESLSGSLDTQATATSVSITLASPRSTITSAQLNKRQSTTQSGVSQHNKRHCPNALKQPQNILKQYQHMQAFPTLELLLNNTVEGSRILCSYKSNNNQLLPRIRSMLTRLIIRNELCIQLKRLPADVILKKFKITSQRLTALAATISKIFIEEEDSFYYIRNDEYTVGSGKLVDHLHYLVGTLKKDGVIESEPVGQSDIMEPDLSQTTDNNAFLEWLNVNVDPWETVETYWKATFRLRRALLQNELTIVQYFDKFKCLSLGNSARLMVLDFDALFPNKKNNLVNSWECLKSTIIEQLKLCSIKDVDDAAKFMILQQCVDGKADAILLHLLPYLIGGSKQVEKLIKTKKNKEGTRKLCSTPASKQEVRESLFIIIAHTREQTTTIENIRRKLEEIGGTLEPFIFLTGTLLNVQEYYSVIDNNIFKTDTLSKSLDLTFKCFWALDCKYPDACENIWKLFQEAIYNISITVKKGEKTSIKFNVLSTALKNRILAN